MTSGLADDNMYNNAFRKSIKPLMLVGGVYQSNHSIGLHWERLILLSSVLQDEEKSCCTLFVGSICYYIHLSDNKGLDVP